MKNFKNYFLSVLLGVAVLVGCKRDDDPAPPPCDDPSNLECPNYDPCFGNEEPSAGFLMEDRNRGVVFSEVIWVPEDSLFRGTEIRFRSIYEGPEYEHKWYVGSQIFETSSVTRNFVDVPRPQVITIHHVLTYPIDSLCYPEATGRDSVAQSFRLINYYSEFMTMDNVFRGVLVGQVDSFDFKVRRLNPDGSNANFTDNQWNTIGINFHNNGDSTEIGSVDIVNRAFSIYGGLYRGRLVIDPIVHSVEMNYTYSDNINYTFKGRVIPE